MNYLMYANITFVFISVFLMMYGYCQCIKGMVPIGTFFLFLSLLLVFIEVQLQP